MSRYIDTKWLEDNAKEYSLGYYEEDEWATPLNVLDSAPSIDIVRCGECEWEWTQKCPPHRMGLIHDASDYCSYGIRKTDGVDKHDEAVEALGHLIKRMKGADDE